MLNAKTVGVSSSGSPIDKLKEAGPEKRRENIKSLDEEQHKDIDLYLERFPNIEITYDARVEDEQVCIVGDVCVLGGATAVRAARIGRVRRVCSPTRPRGPRRRCRRATCSTSR